MFKDADEAIAYVKKEGVEFVEEERASKSEVRALAVDRNHRMRTQAFGCELLGEVDARPPAVGCTGMQWRDGVQVDRTPSGAGHCADQFAIVLAVADQE